MIGRTSQRWKVLVRMERLCRLRWGAGTTQHINAEGQAYDEWPPYTPRDMEDTGVRVRVRARVGAAVWIYRNDHELLLQCPRACARDGEALAAERPLDEVARYQIVWLSTAAVPAPTGDLARDLAAATAAGATHELRELRVE